MIPDGRVEIAGIAVQLIRKRIKYLNLTVYPPDGRVRVSAPLRASERDIRDFVLSRRAWIEHQQTRARQLPAAPVHRYETGEAHPFRGEHHRLEVLPSDGRRARVEHDADERVIRLVAPAESSRAEREKLLERWYRDELVRLVPPTLARWESITGVEANAWGVKRMKTKWGTCNTRAKRIWISLELIKKPPICLDYIMVHELTHLHEPGHGPRFKALMDRFMPDWRVHRETLKTWR